MSKRFSVRFVDRCLQKKSSTRFRLVSRSLLLFPEVRTQYLLVNYTDLLSEWFFLTKYSFCTSKAHFLFSSPPRYDFQVPPAHGFCFRYAPMRTSLWGHISLFLHMRTASRPAAKIQSGILLPSANSQPLSQRSEAFITCKPAICNPEKRWQVHLKPDVVSPRDSLRSFFVGTFTIKKL